MAGEWLKFEANTPEKPEVLAITIAMGWDDPDLTVGKLMRVWRWFDQQTVNGNAPSVTAALLDRLLGVSGLCQAMASVGWLVIDDHGLTLPNFDRHNGKTAKDRALTAKRVATHKSNGKGNAPIVSDALPREEKRREEKEEDKGEKPAPRKRAAPFPVPEWINREHWDAWHSCSKRRNATDKQKQLAVDKLTAWRSEGIDHAAALENAAIGGWQGLFKPDAQKAGGGPAINKQEALEQRNRGVASSWAAGIGNYV
jgi:hypothetical protein